MSDIRKKIYELEKPDNVIIENTGNWHLNKLVYHPSQNNKQTLNINDKHMNHHNNIICTNIDEYEPS